MKRCMMVVAILGAWSVSSSPTQGQGFGRSDTYRGYGYPTYAPVQVGPSGYAYGYTYTHPYTYYPSTRHYHSHFGHSPYGYHRTYRSPVVRNYRVTPNQSKSPFGPAHSSQYFGNPHASQYFGR